MLAIGLMSGTSQDGVDVVLLDTDGERIGQLGGTACRPYSEAERTLLRRATAAAANLTDRTARPEAVAEAERLINDAHAEAVESLLVANGLQREQVAVVGFHGQTLIHRPGRRLTLQIGDGRALATRLGIAVVYDFRAADVAAGGQGRRWRRSFTARWCGGCSAPHRLPSSISAAWRTSPISMASN
jgi:anhydro-N-acetylmuramic acid kinase